MGCCRWDVKEKESVSDSKWKYFTDFSVKIKVIAESRLQFSYVCVCVCVCVHVFGAEDSTNKSRLSTHWMNL